MIKLNDTPIRTSRNFNINNIKLEEDIIPKNIGKFNNIKICKDNSKIKIDNEKISTDLTYGLGNIITNQVNENSNVNLKIDIAQNIEDKQQIDFEFNNESKELVENIKIVANENSKSDIIIKYSSEDEIEAYHNGIIDINAEKDSKLNLIIVNLLNNKSNNFISLQINEKENAKVNITTIDFGGKNSLTNYYTNLQGECSDNKLNTIYLGNKDQNFDINYIAHLRGIKSNVDIDVQGALSDKSKKHFKGTIDFKKGCKKAKGNENENCLLLSKDSRSIAVPMLLCSEEDVEGNHSSSAGKLEDKELFYLMSRGFNLKEAMKLIVRAKFNKIMENIKDDEIYNLIDNEINKKLN